MDVCIHAGARYVRGARRFKLRTLVEILASYSAHYVPGDVTQAVVLERNLTSDNVLLREPVRTWNNASDHLRLLLSLFEQ